MAPASFIPISNTVCVMDASGSIGSSLVRRLLQRGYIVHAAVQPHGELKGLKGLSNDHGNEKLKIYDCDLFDYHSILDALKGCSALFYNFELPYDQPVYDEYTVDTEVRAAQNVLEACAQLDTIDKVVFTSSAATILWREDRQSMLSDLDERHWSDLWHALSKTLAEKSAWALAMDRGISMITINAGLLVGPDLTIRHPYLKGAAEMYQDGVLVTVDLSFLVDAHIHVFEDISTYGRYLCFNHVINRPENAIQLAKILLPSTPVHAQSFQDDAKMIEQKISNEKLKKSIVEFESHPIDQDQNQLIVSN
ncbi:cinnamoyl-CoA reductase-like SNL6 isoform X2 [Chenopodium quinoa]|uniref:NAD-dependent epimerase/dehydratase domain-containing protein n=1 Tax=Chenopodium quinoa TaxID=63459 RepID=A0A803L615_CHEQI|nr:cinnamoyl-CoA reductase-like SNL6 isoform X2 [Chenopodium quinoa]